MTRSGPVVAPALLPVGVVRDRSHRQRRVGATRDALEAARQHERAHPVRAAERRAFAERHAGVVAERGRFRGRGAGERLLAVDEGDVLVRKVEIRERRPRKLAGIGGASRRVRLGKLHELDGVENQALDAGLAEIARARHGDAPIADDPQCDAVMPRFLHELGFAEPHPHAELEAAARARLRHAGAARERAVHDALCQRQQVSFAIVGHRCRRIR